MVGYQLLKTSNGHLERKHLRLEGRSEMVHSTTRPSWVVRRTNHSRVGPCTLFPSAYRSTLRSQKTHAGTARSSVERFRIFNLRAKERGQRSQVAPQES